MSVRKRTWTSTDGKIHQAWVVHVVFTHADGRVETVRKTSPVNTRAGAEDYERQIRNSLLDGSFGVVRVEVPTFKAFWARYTEHITTVADNKPSTLRSKAAIYKAHLAPAFDDLRIDKIDGARIEAFKAALLKKTNRAGAPISKKTAQNILIAFHTALEHAVTFKLLPAVPEFTWLKVPRSEWDFLTYEEADQLLAGCEAEWRPLLTVLLNTGLRIGEACAFKWSDVNLRDGKIRVERAVWRGTLGPPKGGKPREVPLNERAKAAFKSIERKLHVPWVFPDTSDEMRKGSQSLSGVFERQRVASGLRETLGEWHLLRHTFASHLVMRGVSLKAVQELLGHAAQSTTERYAHLAPQVKADAVRALDVPVTAEKEEVGS